MISGDCIFCKIAAGEIPAVKIYEDDAVVSFLDIGPLSDGHALVIPREHFEKFDECSAEVLGRMSAVAAKVAKAVQAAMGSDGYNVLCNTGRAAGQLVGHVHFHVIPRNSGDGVFSQWPAYSYGEGQVEKIAEKIKEKMQ